MKGKWAMVAAVSAMLGIVNAMGHVYVWSHMVLVNPVPHWLIMHGITGNLLRGLLFAHDMIINALLCLPLVLVLRLLRPFHPWAYLALAMLADDVWTFRSIFAEPLPEGMGYGIFVPQFLLTLVTLAMAGMVLAGMVRNERAAA